MFDLQDNNYLISNITSSPLFKALQEISVEDRKRQLEHSQSEIQRVDSRIEEVAVQFKEVEKKVGEHQKKEKVRENFLLLW